MTNYPGKAARQHVGCIITVCSVQGRIVSASDRWQNGKYWQIGGHFRVASGVGERVEQQFEAHSRCRLLVVRIHPLG